MKLHIESPLIESRPLSLLVQRNVWLKLDALQPSGSFKIRGIGTACEAYARQGKRRFISSSGGNAGMAVAYAGRCLNIPVTVVVPQTTTERAKALIARENAEVIVHGASWQEANALAQSMLSDDAAFLHPFDDPLLWAGHASLVDEVAAAGMKPGAVVLSVGGGGLLAGVVQGLRRNGWHDVPVIAMETRGADSLSQSLRAGHRITLDAITSLATSLGAKQVCQEAFDLARSHPVHSVVVEDIAALNACERFLDDHRILVEPACGASLAAVYEQIPQLAEVDEILVVVCGGATATLDQIRQWAARPDIKAA
ncbi:pyridoxal-phosphate dependent enzyme [Allopusillimonas soli]|uniref:L-serine ammonia-lyase n=1 Tax=Allopusillimonas soli TaxID=659016 RepID=A0A853FFX2_9BURK|nr:pyridoxal-phosphate dependent enzyme [Allopusillimonas soli]NYT38983.1 pyridoxal-phosphate dependent enzyme [Allopusillimonas soli]TEA69573.1 pyridoxal-phosphate dependent enzyme [Allopusillimonas soli]